MKTIAAPTPMPAFAPVPSPPESEVVVSWGKLDESPGTGDVATAPEFVGTAVGVKGTPILLASEAAYAGGNFDKSSASHPIHIASARAQPFDTKVAFVFVVYARLPDDRLEGHQYALKTSFPNVLTVSGANAVRGVLKEE